MCCILHGVGTTMHGLPVKPKRWLNGFLLIKLEVAMVEALCLLPGHRAPDRTAHVHRKLQRLHKEFSLRLACWALSAYQEDPA